MRALPHNIEAEQQVLGGLLIRNDMFWEIEAIVRQADFFDPLHDKIFSVIADLCGGYKSATAFTVRDFLPTNVTLPRGYASTTDYLGALAEGVISPHQAIEYARLVADLGMRRRLIVTMQDGIQKLADLDPAKPCADLADDIGASVLGVARRETESLRLIGDIARDEANEIAKALSTDTPDIVGLSWGIQAMDELLGPAMSGKMYVIAGISGGAKSALIGQCSEHMGALGQGAGLIISLEMMGYEWAHRGIARRTSIPAWKLEQRKVNARDSDVIFDAAEALRKTQLFIEDRTDLTIAQIKSRALRIKQKHGLAFVAIDHILLIESERKDPNVYDLVEAGTRGSKKLAKELKVPVILLSQLKDAIWDREDNRPREVDLFGGRAIKRHADAGVFVHREEVFLAQKKPAPDKTDRLAAWQQRMDLVKGKAELIQFKRRAAQDGQSREIQFDGVTTSFIDLQERR